MQKERSLTKFILEENKIINKGWVNWEFNSSDGYLHLCTRYPRKFNPKPTQEILEK